ncbi:hypothetical protein BT63DRAFT_167878 [Microthyrium microscopicum]|uniref:Uncharacterized protein n=1 Tax=Microthyrium microscopicum TaxID=703497 RepID=A0A6A6UNJ5_9PEZI|nr:hypothetical protein BT63DRAFT_167878 [Microthyrium microscopicum]
MFAMLATLSLIVAIMLLRIDIGTPVITTIMIFSLVNPKYLDLKSIRSRKAISERIKDKTINKAKTIKSNQSPLSPLALSRQLKSLMPHNIHQYINPTPTLQPTTTLSPPQHPNRQNARRRLSPARHLRPHPLLPTLLFNTGRFLTSPSNTSSHPPTTPTPQRPAHPPRHTSNTQRPRTYLPPPPLPRRATARRAIRKTYPLVQQPNARAHDTPLRNIRDTRRFSIRSDQHSAGASNPFWNEKLFYVGASIFYASVGLEIAAEIQRHTFKRKPENEGKLCTSGFWAMTRHVN